MANKDHSLDGKIIKAAKEEFMANGYQKASLHKIAANAGITTGALYTRYKSKDDLFCSLITPMFGKVDMRLNPLKHSYTEARRKFDLDEIIKIVKEERKLYLDMLFEHYEEGVLFLCKSDGSSVDELINKMLDARIKDIISFLSSLSSCPIDFDGVGFIVTQQFYCYRKLLEKGYDKQKAASCMETVEIFLSAGWEKLLKTIFN